RPSSSKVSRVVLGREDFSVRQASPSASKARTASRTDWTQHPTAAAIALGLWPSALWSRTWQRRSVNASEERRPALRAARSSSVSGRTKVGGFMAPIFARREPLAQELY